MSEVDGILFWSMILYPDIFTYLTFYPSELKSDDLNDYKKAYSYFSDGWLSPLSYHEVHPTSKYCLVKGDCRPSERLSDTPHKFWFYIEKQTVKIQSAYCSCMAGMSQTCNHVAAALFRMEAAARTGLTNPSCTEKSCQWFPNRKKVQPMRLKDINFSRSDFGKRGKKTRPLVSTPKKIFNPVSKKKLPTLTDIGKALEDVSSNLLLSTAAPKPKVDFVREVIPKPSTANNILSIDDIMLFSFSVQNFMDNINKNMTEENIDRIEVLTRGQNTNDSWYQFRKYVITASKSHNIIAKMNMWSLFQNISGLTFVNPNIPSLKYGTCMEVNASNTFDDLMKKYHRNLKLVECGLFLDKTLPFIGSSPDRIATCLCCPPSCLEIN